MPNSKKIYVGIIGGGFIGEAHIEAVRRIPGVEVLAIAGSSLDSAREKANKFDIPLAYGSYQELFANPDIQVIHNCTPNNMHFTVNRDALLAGKHVLSEKPLAINCEETGELVRLAEQQGLIAAVSFNYRQYPLVQEMKARIENNEIGKVNLIYGSYLQDWLLRDTDWSWRLDPKVGGNSRAIADIGSHWMDLVQHVVGSRIIKVMADLDTILPVRKKPKGKVTTFGNNQADNFEEIAITTEDYGTILFRMENGARGVFTVSQMSPGRKNRLSFEVAGSEMSMAWNQEEPQYLWIGHRDKPNEVLMRDPNLLSESARPWAHYPGGHEEGWPDGMKNLMKNLYDYVREGKVPTEDSLPFATFAEAHRVSCLVEAICKSNQQGTWVDIP